MIMIFCLLLAGKSINDLSVSLSRLSFLQQLGSKFIVIYIIFFEFFAALFTKE